ncbi:MAG: hypothetical protein HYW57_10485, partial [Ignavibacteriales bacterium]|nr:hypothetical protein [Ignavibacteriales bacterium]
TDSVYLVSNTRGYIEQSGGWICASNDGGKTWTTQTQLAVTTGKIAFANSNEGWVAGGNGNIFHTIDGGAAWLQQTSPTTRALRGISIVSPTDIYAAGNAVILHYNGSAWSKLSQSSDIIATSNGVAFPNANTGYVVGNNTGTEGFAANVPIVRKSIDGGVGWTVLGTGEGTGGVTINDIFCIDPSTCWFVGKMQRVRKTTDGGATWVAQVLSISSTPIMNAIFFKDANNGWAVGTADTTVRTTNGGSTWSTVTVSGSHNAVYFDSAGASGVGYIAGESGRIYKSTNGGANWTLQTSGVTTGLNGVWCTDADTCSVVGDGGVIRKTTDGGANWNTQISGVSGDLTWIRCADANTCYIAGAKSPASDTVAILKTNNGGANWVVDASTGGTPPLTRLSIAENFVWAVGGGYGGVIKSSVTAADTTPPDTVIDAGPASPTNSASAAFTFHATESGSTFECQLDGGGFTSCTSPKSYAGLTDGSHAFNVRATDAAGNTDATPATFSWVIDTIAPISAANPNPATPNGDNGWYTTDVQYAVTATDSGSGVAEVLGCTDTTNPCAPLAGGAGGIVTAEGDNYIRFQSRDNAGNLENLKVQLVKIDKTNP